MKDIDTIVPEEGAVEAGQAPNQWAPRQRATHLTNEEMIVSALAHASVILGVVTGGLAGVAIALVLWLIYKDKSRYIAFQAMQALVFQLAIAAVLLLAGITMVISFVTICLIPVGLILLLALIALPFAALFYGLYGAYETYYGEDFQYAWVGELVTKQGQAAEPVEEEPEEE